MVIIYSIPVKAVKNNGAIRCTVPKEIVNELTIDEGDMIVWTLYDSQKLEVAVRKRKKC